MRLGRLHPAASLGHRKCVEVPQRRTDSDKLPTSLSQASIRVVPCRGSFYFCLFSTLDTTVSYLSLRSSQLSEAVSSGRVANQSVSVTLFRVISCLS